MATHTAINKEQAEQYYKAEDVVSASEDFKKLPSYNRVKAVEQINEQEHYIFYLLNNGFIETEHLTTAQLKENEKINSTYYNT